MRLTRNDDKLNKLAKHQLLAGCRRAELTQIARAADEIWVGAGSVIARRGQRVREFVLVAEGSAHVLAEGRPVASIESGGWLGDGEVMAGRKSDFDVVASTDMTLFIVPQQAFTSLIRRIPTLSTRLLTAFALTPSSLPTKARLLPPVRRAPVPARA